MCGVTNTTARLPDMNLMNPPSQQVSSFDIASLEHTSSQASNSCRVQTGVNGSAISYLITSCTLDNVRTVNPPTAKLMDEGYKACLITHRTPVGKLQISSEAVNEASQCLVGTVS